MGVPRSVTFGISETRRQARKIVAMGSGIFSNSRSTYTRVSLMVLIEAIAGLFLYALFTFMPLALQMLVATACWGIVAIDNLTFPKNKSLGSVLCGITGAATFSCGVAWRITNGETWSRLMPVGTCLLAGLIFLDRREQWLDLV